MGEAVESLRTVEALRNRTRLERSGHWFVLVVFGIVTLGAMPFYWSPLASPASPVASAAPPGCRAALQSGFACVVGSPGTPLGGALNPQPVGFALNRWATVYWSVAVLVGFATIVLYYRRRARAVGVQGRVWPAAAAGVGLLAAVVFVNGEGRAFPSIPDFWIRGTGALLIIAIGIAVLAVLERSRPFAAFAAGAIAVALLSCLYNDVNIFQRLGLGGPFQGSANELPNLILPGIYLLLGGFGFLLGRRWTIAIRLARRPV